MATVAESAAAVNLERHLRWKRPEQVMLFEAYQTLRAQGLSQRSAAGRLGVPRTTLQAWKACAETLDADPVVVAFFESTQGLAFLHRLLVAMHVVFVEVGACGIRLVCQALQLSGLDRFIASSYESQRRVNVSVQHEIVRHATNEATRLAPQMLEKDITAALDETFTGGLTLVAIEAESDFILLEQTAETRDSAAWKAAMDKAMAGLRCKIFQVAGDLGKGLVAYAENLLGAHHSPDLFHVQQEGSRAVSAPMAAKARAAARGIEEAKANLAKTEVEAKEYAELIDQRGPGRPPNWEARIQEAKDQVVAAEAEAERVNSVRDAMREAVRGLGKDYHLVDLATGERCASSIITQKLQVRIDTLRAAAVAEGLSEASLNRIAKAERVLPRMAATVDFVSDYVRREVDKLGLTGKEAYLVHAKLIPACYLERVASRENKKDGAPLTEMAAGMKAPLFDAGGAFAGLDPEARERLVQQADRLAGAFQRSSSCVEGRNGVLSFRHHELRGLPDRKRQSLTALHNFFSQRRDGTTAAERFFGQKPRSLFQAVLTSVDTPRRPRSPACKVSRGVSPMP
jgi:hypothetical protein